MILCGVISRGTTILAKYIQQVAGNNMNEFIDKVLGNISVISDTRNSYRVTETQFLVHYISERGIVYLAIAQENIPQENVFKFLEEVKEKFQRYAGDRARSALANEFDGDFGKVLTNGMLRATPSKIDDCNEDMRKVKELMVKAIEAALQRGVILGELDEKIDVLLANSGTFNREAVQIQPQPQPSPEIQIVSNLKPCGPTLRHIFPRRGPHMTLCDDYPP